jgi:hypothetical protein
MTHGVGNIKIITCLVYFYGETEEASSVLVNNVVSCYDYILPTVMNEMYDALVE